MSEGEMVRFDAQRPDLPEVGRYTREAAMIVIDDQFTYDAADEFLSRVKTFAKGVEAERKKAVDPLNKLKDVIQGWFKPVLDDCAAAEDAVKSSMLTYGREQKRIAAEKQAEADKAVREERQRLAKLAAEEAAKGNTEKAEAITSVAAVISAPVVAQAVTQPKGTHTVKTWKARVAPGVADPVVAVAAFVAANPQYAALLSIELGAATKLARLMENKFCIPGLEAYEEETLAKRT